MVFPQTPLDYKCELSLGGAWTNITSYINQGSGGSVGISGGHPDESTQAPASQSAATLANTDFRFTSSNPAGPYYPWLQRNTPLRLSLAGQAAALRMEDDTTSSASAPGSGVLPSGANDMDIRVDVSPSGYSPCVLASWWASGQRGWCVALNGDGTVTFSWTTDGTLGTLTQASSTAAVPLGPVVIRVTLAHATGVVTFYTAAAGGISGGPFTQLGASAGPGSATTVFASTAVLAAGASAQALADFSVGGMTGRVSDLLVMSGIAGTVKAQAAFSSQSPGAVSWADAQGNTWSVTGSATIDQRSYRFHGEAAGWPQTWDPTAHDVKANVSVSGPIRRIAQRQSVLSSPDYRGPQAAGSLTAQWPMEDGKNATQFASAVPGGLPMQIVSGTPSLAADSTFPGSNALPQLSRAVLFGPVSNYIDTGTIVIRFLFCPHGVGLITDVLMNIATTGTAASGQLTLLWNGAGSGQGGTLAVNSGPTVAVSDADQVMVSVELTPSGGSIAINLRVMAVAGVITSATTSFLTGTTGRLLSVTLNSDSQNWGSTVIGHLFAQSALTALSGMAGPLAGWLGETAGNRFARICAENNLRARIWGYPNLSQPMGPQPIDTLANILQQCADTDRGIMSEPTECLGLAYRTLASMLNQAPALTIAYGQLASPLGETEDDQITVNDVTVNNADGSSARQYQATGPMSVLEPEQGGAGTIDQQYPVNLATDTGLNDEAGFILSTGTVPQPRYPSVKIDLATSDATIQALWWQVLGLRLGDRLVITTPPGMLPPGNIDQLVQGQKTRIYDKVLNFDLACVPSLPYLTGVLDDVNYGRADTDGSQLHASITAGATTMQVDTTGPSGILWTVGIAPNGQPTNDFPFGIMVAAAGGVTGEEMTVTAITGASSPQTFTVVRAVNGVSRAWPAGSDVRLYPTPVFAIL